MTLHKGACGNASWIEDTTIIHCIEKWRAKTNSGSIFCQFYLDFQGWRRIRYHSDHHLISSNISAVKPQPSTRVIHRRCISSINWEIFEPDLLCVSEELLTCDLDANDYAILLNNKLVTLLDKHAPVKKRSVRVGQHPNNQLSSGLCPGTPAFHDLYLTPVRHS